MAVTSGFFNSLNGDRKYNAEQMSAIFDGVINDGIFANIGTAFTVTSTSGNDVQIGIGRAWFNSTWIYNDAILPMTLPDAEVVLDRIDAIVIEVNHTDEVRAGSIKVVQGTASSSPVNPTLTNTEDVHQYVLAYVYREGDSTSFDQSSITSMIGTEGTPYITGILQVQSIDNIVAQWQQQWINWFAAEQTEGEAAKTELINAWNEWFAGETTSDESEFNTWLNQMKNDFLTWYESLQAVLEPDVATNLANKVTELEERFGALAKDRVVWEDLEDSSSPTDTIEDSQGRVIQGRTKFAASGELAGSGINASIPFDFASGGESGLKYEIGDTLTTARTDLDDTWALCNGAQLDREQYSALSSLIPDNPAVNTGQIETMVVGHAQLNAYPYISKIAYSSTHVAFVSYNNDNYLRVYYKAINDDPNTNWSSRTIYTFGSGITGRFDDTNHTIGFDFLNGQFVVTFSIDDTTGSNTSRKVWLLHTAGANPNVNWTTRTVYTRTDTSYYYYYAYAFNVKYVNGYYVVCGTIYDSYRSSGSSTTYPCIWYSANLASNWYMVQIGDAISNGSNSYRCSDIIYDGTKYIAVGYFFKSSPNIFTGMAYAVNIASWSFYTSTGYLTASTSWRIFYNEEDQTYVAIQHTSSSVYYAKNIAGSWNTVNLSNAFRMENEEWYGEPRLQSIIIADGWYIIAGICFRRSDDGTTCSSIKYRVIGSKSLNGPWALNELYANSYYASNMINYISMPGFGVSDSEFAIVSKQCTGSSSARTTVYRWDRSLVTLPSVSLSNELYTYIKILEG